MTGRPVRAQLCHGCKLFVNEVCNGLKTYSETCSAYEPVKKVKVEPNPKKKITTRSMF